MWGKQRAVDCEVFGSDVLVADVLSPLSTRRAMKKISLTGSTISNRKRTRSSSIWSSQGRGSKIQTASTTFCTPAKRILLANRLAPRTRGPRSEPSTLHHPGRDYSAPTRSSRSAASSGTINTIIIQAEICSTTCRLSSRSRLLRIER